MQMLSLVLRTGVKKAPFGTNSQEHELASHNCKDLNLDALHAAEMACAKDVPEHGYASRFSVRLKLRMYKGFPSVWPNSLESFTV